MEKNKTKKTQVIKVFNKQKNKVIKKRTKLDL